MTTPISDTLLKLIDELNQEQKQWLSGYCWALSTQHRLPEEKTNTPSTSAISLTGKKITILAASQTGNAWRSAKSLSQLMNQAHIEHRLIRASSYKIEEMATEEILLMILATYGKGEATEDAEPLAEILFSANAPQLNHLAYAVLGLGDSSFEHFCGFAEKMDTQLTQLGATQIHPLTKCDVDFKPQSEEWFKEILARLSTEKKSEQHNETSDIVLFSGSLKERTRLSCPNSEKNTQHIVLTIKEANFHYQPGDALGIYCHNDSEMIQEILHYCHLDGSEIIFDGKKNTPIRQALKEQCDITRNHPKLLQQYAEYSKHPDLTKIVQQTDTLHDYILNTPIIGLMAEYPCALDAQTLFSLLLPLQPRYYSIASSPKHQAQEVALTIGVRHFRHHNKEYQGSASGYLCNTLALGESVQLFVVENPTFRLPENPDTPIIMIAAGTGIAPFRGFMQERAQQHATGKNWLIFGNRHAEQDFFYREEWQAHLDSGLLSQLDFTASRATEEKQYIHHLMENKSQQIYSWLENNATLYLCGSAEHLASSVDKTLLNILRQEGNMDEPSAEHYLKQLKAQRRYLKDTY